MSETPLILPTFTPVPRQRMRRGGWSADRQREFIATLAETGSVRAACRRMGVGEHHIYKLRRHPEGESFRKAWEAALDLGIARIEDIAMDRALNGVEQPVYHQGEIVGTRRAYNDRLLMFMLKNRAPERFAEGRARRPDAISAMQVKRQKRHLKRKWKQKWRAEWEAEQASVSHAEIAARIDAKVERVRASVEAERAAEWEALSEETRNAWERFEELRERDLDKLKADEAMRRRLREGPRNRETINPDPADFKRKPKEPKPRKTVWTLKDEGWGPDCN